MSTFNCRISHTAEKMKTHYSILGFLYSNRFYLFTSLLVGCCCSHEDGSFIISSFTYAKTSIGPYDWRYIRVDLPASFSLVTLALESDVHFDKDHVKEDNVYNLPIICVREGSPPLPDAYNISTTGLVLDPISYESLGTQSLQFAEKCYPMQKNILLTLTNKQISSGVWYFGLFNGIESTSAQSNMIIGGSWFSFKGNVSIEGCMGPSISGPFCNQTVDQLYCVDHNSTQQNLVSCRNSYESSCSGTNEPKVYTFDLFRLSETITISTSKVKVNRIQLSNATSNLSSIGLMCYVRHGAMPSSSVHDYSGNIIDAPLAIQSPKAGRWYITILPLDLSNGSTGNLNVCYSLTWQMHRCPRDKAGVNCTWERYMLQTILRKNPSLPFESYYIPETDNGSSRSPNFLLEPLLSYNSLNQSQSQSRSQSQDFAWTYFVADIPLEAAGGSMHVRINSDTKIKYEIYALYGGLPLEDKWDYFYVNSTSNSNGSMFFKLYDSDEKSVGFYIVYPRGGTWGFGIKHLTSSSQSQSQSQSQTTMMILVERCPRKCSSHGTCQNAVEMSGLSLYSYCDCDRTHGGFDCSIELASHRGWTKHRHSRGSDFGSQAFEHAYSGHILQSVSLIASNAAFVFPAYWALRQKAFAEWVLYTSSGISSGLYHACNAGIWCALSLHVLRFLDFWLTFMSVVTTFVYLAAINEASKRTINTAAVILTALVAETRATKSSNVVLVIAIGVIGLFAGWLIEFFTQFFTHFNRFSFSAQPFMNMIHRWQTIKGWLHNLVITLVKRFRWFFILAGVVALSMVVISWRLESTESYWFWHSIWHVSIYTASFFFLCSKVDVIDCENQGSTNRDYQLTRQDSLSRGEDRQACT